MHEGEGVLAPGEVLHDTYRILRLLGVGGTGEVYEAEDLAIGGRRAIKVLKPHLSRDETYIDLLRREVRLDIRSDAVVRYYVLQRLERLGLWYLVMDYVDGPQLAGAMAERGPLPPEELIALAIRVADGLQAAHEQGVFHRDIAPDNILLEGGRPEGAMLIDFGIAKNTRPGAGSVIGGGFAGKYEYAAPEQFLGKAEARSDIYALGATLLAAARGVEPQVPYDYGEVLDLKNHPLDISDQPEPLRSLLAGMLAPKPEDRWADAADMRRAAEQAAAGITPAPPGDASAPGPGPGPAPASLGGGTPPPALGAQGPSPGAPPRPAAAPSERKRENAGGGGGGRLALLAAAALLVVAGAGAGWWFLLGPGAGPRWPTPAQWRFEAAAGPDRAPVLAGFAPSEEARAALAEAARAAGVASARPEDLTLGAEPPSAAWAEGLRLMLEALSEVESWRLTVIDDRAVLSGSDPDEADVADARRRAGAAAAAAGLRLERRLEHVPPGPDVAALSAQLAEVLEGARDCGPITAEVAWEELSEGAVPRLSGRVATQESRLRLAAAVSRITAEAGGGPPSVAGVEVLFPAACWLFDRLPPLAPPPGAGFAAAGGGAPDWTALPRESGREVYGQFGVPVPAVELRLPAGATGHLHLFAIDDDELVIPLAPSVFRPESEIAALAEPGAGPGPVIRVTRSAEETAREATLIDAHLFAKLEAGRIRRDAEGRPLFGEAVLIALVAPEPLYTRRPDEERVEDFAEALLPALREARAGTGSLYLLDLHLRVAPPE